MNDAYAAGLFDGEGSVILNAGTYGSLSLACTMHLTHEPTLRLLAAQYGGSVHTVKRNRLLGEGMKPMWGWRASGANAEAFLRAVQPFLLIKVEQAALALEFRAASATLRGVDPVRKAEILAERLDWKRRMQTLNQSRYI